MHHRLWFPFAPALLSHGRVSDQIYHREDHLDQKSTGRISSRLLPCLPPHRACSLPVGWHSMTRSTVLGSAKVMANKSQEETEQHKKVTFSPLTKGPITPNVLVSEQVRKSKKSSFISHFSLERWIVRASFENT